MNSFTISQMQRHSGINVHRIRAWEKRYQALKPGRSEGNTRYYDAHQLRRLLNIAGLVHSGYKPSELCGLPDAKLHELAGMIMDNETAAGSHDEFLVSQLVASALEFNESLFEKVFSRAVIQYDTESAYLRVIYPALKRLGMMWTCNRAEPAHEHFFCNLIRQKLNASIALLPLNEGSRDHWILFLPENEIHETGLLMANFLVRQAGHRCTYLGANLPADSLHQAVKTINPAYLLFFLVSGEDEQSDKGIIQEMLNDFPSTKIFVAAESGRLSGTPPHPNLVVLHSLPELKELLKKMSE